MIFSETQLERYSRHFVLREIGVSGQEKLLNSKVLVIGAGALGSGALMYLASSGVGTIGIADYDTVEMSNLARQVIHTPNRVGMKKTDSAAITLKNQNPDVSLNLYSQRVTADNITELMEPYDFVIDATDRFETKFLINDACVLSKKPYSHAGVLRFGGQAMTYVPGMGPCLRCVLGDIPPYDESMGVAGSGILGTLPGIFGAIQATEAIKYLLGIGELLTGGILNLDALDMKIRVTKIEHSDPQCRICGETPDIVSLAENRKEYVINPSS